MTRRVSELIRICPECREDTAVHLGDVPGYSLYACVRCDAEFHVGPGATD